MYGILEKKVSKFQHFVLFWIPHPKIDKSTNFHKNLVN